MLDPNALSIAKPQDAMTKQPVNKKDSNGHQQGNNGIPEFVKKLFWYVLLKTSRMVSMID